MVNSRDIQSGNTTFFVLNVFGTYMVYETGFGNLIKIYSQTAYGPINRVTKLVDYMRKQRKVDRIKIMYFESNQSKGLVECPTPRKITGDLYKQNRFKFTPLSKPPAYELLVEETKIFYCIQSGKNYFLYDYDFGNPLMGQVSDNNNNKFLVRSSTKKQTLMLIKSLPDDVVVYSLKVDSSAGLVDGDTDMKKFELTNAKKKTENLVKVKRTDKTKLKLTTQELRIKKRDEIYGIR